MLHSDWLSYYWAICYSPLIAKRAGFLAAKKDESVALTSLRSKRFRAVSEQRKTKERDSRFWPREK